MVRLIVGVALLAVGASAFADRLIVVPQGRQISENTLRLSGFFNGQSQTISNGLAEFGLGPFFDVEAAGAVNGAGISKTAFGFSYNYLPPVQDIVPGISFGMRDIGNVTSTGRQAFIAITQQSELEMEINHQLYASVTLGMLVGKTAGPFVGIAIPFGTNFQILAEDDGRFVNGGIEFAFSQGRLRLLEVNSVPQIELQWTIQLHR